MKKTNHKGLVYFQINKISFFGNSAFYLYEKHNKHKATAFTNKISQRINNKYTQIDLKIVFAMVSKARKQKPCSSKSILLYNLQDKLAQ